MFRRGVRVLPEVEIQNRALKKEIELRYKDTAKILFQELLETSPLYFHLYHPSDMTVHGYLHIGYSMQSKYSQRFTQNGNNPILVGTPIYDRNSQSYAMTSDSQRIDESKGTGLNKSPNHTNKNQKSINHGSKKSRLCRIS